MTSPTTLHETIPTGSTNVRWSKVGALLLISYLVAYIDRTNMSIAAPTMIKELGLDASQMGMLMSAFFGGYVFSLAFAGLIVTKLGAKRSMVVALFVFGIASAATGLTENYIQLIFVRIMLGIGEGFVFPAITLFFVQWFPTWERGRASGLSLLSIPISAIIMAPMGGWLINILGYKEMFIIQGLPPIIIAFFVMTFLKDDPSQDKTVNKIEMDYIVRNRGRVEPSSEQSSGAFKAVYLNIKIWTVGIVYLLWMTGLYGFNQWLPTILSEASGSGIQTVGWLTAMPFVFAAVGMIFVSTGSDKATNRTPWVSIPIAIAGIALLLQHIVGGGIWMQLTFLTIAGIGIHAAFGPWWPWALEGVSAQHTGYASSLVLSVGNFGGIIGPMLVGFLTGGGTVAEGGFYVLGYVLIASAIIGFILSVVRKNTQISNLNSHMNSSTNS